MRHFVASMSMPLSTLSLIGMSGEKVPYGKLKTEPPDNNTNAVALQTSTDNAESWRSLRHRRLNKTVSGASSGHPTLPLATQRQAVVSEFVKEFTQRPGLGGFIPSAQQQVPSAMGGGVGRGGNIMRHISMNYGQYGRNWMKTDDIGTLRSLGGYTFQGMGAPITGIFLFVCFSLFGKGFSRRLFESQFALFSRQIGYTKANSNSVIFLLLKISLRIFKKK